MLKKVSEVAKYSDNNEIPIEAEVEIIEKKYTKMGNDFASGVVSDSDIWSYFSIDDNEFIKGSLKSNTIIKYNADGMGRGTVREYEVDVGNGAIIKFKQNEYFFKVMSKPKPSTGGKKSRSKRNNNKSRKKRRKYTRRH